MNLNKIIETVEIVVKKHFKDYNDRQDAFQECMIKILNKYNMFDSSKAQIKTWAYSVARNHCIDIIRKKQITKKHFSYVEISNVSLPETNNQLTKDDAKYIKLIIEKLTVGIKPEYLQILYFCKAEGYSYKEAAEKFNTSNENIRTIIFRVIKKIKAEAKKQGLLNKIKYTYIN